MAKSYKVRCDCKHEFQDTEHGKQNRVANPTTKKYLDGTIDVRCTVCTKLHHVKKD